MLLLQRPAVALYRSSRLLPRVSLRAFTNKQGYDALVLGAYTNGDLALAASTDITSSTRSHILDQLACTKFKKPGDVCLLYNVGGVKQVAVVSLGDKNLQLKQPVLLDSVRKAAAIGVLTLKKHAINDNIHIGVDVSVDAHAAAEGATLAQFSFDKLKNKKDPVIRIGPFGTPSNESSSSLGWESGQIYGTAQNLARMLMTTPANLMTPKLFSEEVAYLLAGLENVEVVVHDKDWAVRNKMNAFLSVAQGSNEPLRFLEIHYKGGRPDGPIHGLVGKGVTFDSGGISIKPSQNMELMKGDMGGAAAVASAMYAISKLRLPVNVVAMIPLCENLPSGNATKPGDVVKAMNGKSIEITNTDAEGRLILADALYYLSSTYSPRSLIDVATLTGAMDVALGQTFAGVFTNSDELWEQLQVAGEWTADQFWRMPLHEDYLETMQASSVADLLNAEKSRSAGSCTAAAFLKEFVAGLDNEGQESTIQWAHIDIAGVMDCQSPKGYNLKGMTGRPTRSLVEYIRRLAQ